METYIETQDDKFAVQLNNYCEKIDGYKVTLNLDNGKITALKQSRELVLFIMPLNVAAQDFGHSFVAYKNLMRYGHGNDVLGAIPVLPAMVPPIPTVTNANIQGQFADLIQDCVRSPNFTRTIGEDLGIVKPETIFDPQAGKPIIKAKLAEGGHPLLHNKIGKYDGWELWKDRNDTKGYVKIKEVLHPDYLDLDPLPALGSSIIWKYKAVYIYKDKQAGEWSDELGLTVYGHV